MSSRTWFISIKQSSYKGRTYLDLLITNISDRIANFSLQMPFSSNDHDSFSFFLGIFSCLPVFNTNITSDMCYFDHANFPAMKANLQSLN